MINLRNIAEEYLASFPSEGKKEKEKIDNTKNYLKKISVAVSKQLSTHTKTDLVLNEVFVHSQALEEELTREKEPVLETSSWQDFNLLCGHATTREKHVLNYVNRTKTIAGSAVLATQLVNPYTDEATIATKQEVSKALLAEEATSKALEQEIEVLSDNEAAYLHLFQTDNPLTHPVYKKELDTFYSLPRGWGLNFFKQSATRLQLVKSLKDLLRHLRSLIYIGFALLYRKEVIEAINDLRKIKFGVLVLLPIVISLSITFLQEIIMFRSSRSILRLLTDYLLPYQELLDIRVKH